MKAKDILRVRERLSHKNIKSTLIYIDVERAIYQPGSEEFTVRVAKNVEEASQLIEVGFEYVCQNEASYSSGNGSKTLKWRVCFHRKGFTGDISTIGLVKA